MAAELERRPIRHESLAELVTRMRQASGGYVLTAVRHGAHDAAAQRLLQALRALGVPEATRPARTVLDDVGLSLIQLEPRNAGTPAPGLPSALLLSSGVPSQALLVPAVQKVREAASRLRQQVRYTLYASDETPTRTGHAAGHKRWIELNSMSTPL